MSTRLIIVFGGMGSGKDTVAEFMREELGGPEQVTIFTTSAIIDIGLNAYGIPANRTNQAKMFRTLAQIGDDVGFGPGWLTNAANAQIKLSKKPYTIFTGARTRTDDELKKDFPGAKVLLVRASQRSRYDRMIERARQKIENGTATDKEREEFLMSWAVFQRRDQASNEQYVPPNPDHVIDNDSGIANLRIKAVGFCQYLRSLQLSL